MRRCVYADKFKSDIKDVAEINGGSFTEFEVLGILSGQPTADVRENVRGEWIDAQYPFSKCSICDCYFDTANNEANFCPNCGAQMIGDKE